MSTAAQSFRPAPIATGGYLRVTAIGVLVTSVAGLLLFWAAKVQNREIRRQLNAMQDKSVAAIKENSDAQTDVYDASLIDLIAADPEAAGQATTLVFRNLDFSVDNCHRVSQLKNLRNVGFHSCEHMEVLLHDLEGAASIEKIFFENSILTDNCIRLLATLPHLRQVHLEQSVTPHQASLLHALLPGVWVRTPFLERNEPVEVKSTPPLR
jgi:hypothetical protein